LNYVDILFVGIGFLTQVKAQDLQHQYSTARKHHDQGQNAHPSNVHAQGTKRPFKISAKERYRPGEVAPMKVIMKIISLIRKFEPTRRHPPIERYLDQQDCQRREPHCHERRWMGNLRGAECMVAAFIGRAEKADKDGTALSIGILMSMVKMKL